MYPRTRNFILVLLSVGVFSLALFAAFGGNVFKAWQHDPDVEFSSVDNLRDEYEAEVPQDKDSRGEYLSQLKAKIAERLTLKNAEEDTKPTIAVASSTEEDKPASTTAEVVSVKKCASYRTLQIPWTPQSVIQESREGMRVYFERGLPAQIGDIAPENIRALIPMRVWPLSQGSCLPTDVVGIALDGSLIRNNETALYNVFGEGTLIGYSLDGYPIYGESSGVVSDVCGGALVGGSYRYMVSKTRETIINCYVGVPVTLN